MHRDDVSEESQDELKLLPKRTQKDEPAPLIPQEEETTKEETNESSTTLPYILQAQKDMEQNQDIQIDDNKVDENQVDDGQINPPPQVNKDDAQINGDEQQENENIANEEVKEMSPS